MNNNQEPNEQSLSSILLSQEAAFQLCPNPSYEVRIENLKQLKTLILDNQENLTRAMSEDFGHRAADDSKIGDLLTAVSGINYSISKLKKWMKPKKRHVGILFQPASARVEYQPVGVVGIMVPWNYPIFLALGPLTAALAAGNHAMIKMSEFTHKTSQLLASLMAKCFPLSLVTVISGDEKVAQEFSSLPFAHLFFTGSTQVGRYVMQAAAKNLTPVTLELGGKSPAIIDDKISLDTAVDRLLFGKTLNAGQTCVAPDYIFCPRDRIDALTAAFKNRFQALFPTIVDNKDYTSIVNDSQYSRLAGLLNNAEEHGAKVTNLACEEHCEQSRKFPLTILSNVNDDMKVMQQEIFGPILPIVPYDKVEDAISYINSHERPLALYICSFNKKFQHSLLKSTISGGVCINESAFHVAVEDLPFGGIGDSGMGHYHGEEGFKTFSHAKAVLAKGRISLTSLLFPPYGTSLHKLVYKLFIR